MRSQLICLQIALVSASLPPSQQVYEDPAIRVRRNGKNQTFILLTDDFDRVTLQEAIKRCSLVGSIVTISSEEEQKFAESFVDGKEVWLNSEINTQNGYTNWQVGEPDSSNRQYKGVMMAREGKWSLFPVDVLAHLFCQVREPYADGSFHPILWKQRRLVIEKMQRLLSWGEMMPPNLVSLLLGDRIPNLGKRLKESSLENEIGDSRISSHRIQLQLNPQVTLLLH